MKRLSNYLAAGGFWEKLKIFPKNHPKMLEVREKNSFLPHLQQAPK
jgi:hypothetical protein